MLAQAAADRFARRRIRQVGQGLAEPVYALATLDIAWTPLKVAMLPVMVISGAAVFGAVFVRGAAFQFVAPDASQVPSAFTYGAPSRPRGPADDLREGPGARRTFVVPLAFVSWLPTLYVLDREYPLDLPQWVAFLSPVVAVAFGALAGLAWRAALRTYRSTGS
ncbi:Transporter OS=Streptomyces microflavus OX=1919 GN=Smic_27710 PE=4 SV=1 [Streptomyces microflavus]